MLADSAYGSGDTLAAPGTAEHRILIKPRPTHRNPNLSDDQFSRDDFSIDDSARTVTCPNDVTTHLSVKGTATFGSKCRVCPVRSHCTSAIDGKTFVVGEHDQLLAGNRARWSADTGLVTDNRQHRPMVERSIAWLVSDGATADASTAASKPTVSLQSPRLGADPTRDNQLTTEHRRHSSVTPGRSTTNRSTIRLAQQSPRCSRGTGRP